MRKIKTGLYSIYLWLCRINEDPKQKYKFLVIAAFLSFFSIRFLPFSFRFTIPFALDFGNPYWFQNCIGHQDSPYFVAGHICGDVLDRSMIYPPLIYWSYFWTRGLSFALASGLWTAFILLGIYWSLRSLPEYRKQLWPWTLYFALLLQFPTLFAIERGNNDIFVLVSWSFLLIAWRHRQFFVAGAIGALAVMLKLYPATALLIWGFGFLSSVHQDKEWFRIYKRPEFIFCLGFFLSAALLFLAFYDQNIIYFTKILPDWMNARQGRDVSLHSLYSIGPGGDLSMAILALVLIVSWSKMSARKFKEDPLLVWSGLLALSTYFSGVSNDYNLITTYPLIALCWFRSFSGNQKNMYFAFFATSFLGAIGLRWFWKNPLFHLVGMHIVFQVFWLAAFLALTRLTDKDLKLESVDSR